MKTNSRFLLLEYLYSLQLPNLNQMTFCFWDKVYPDDLAQMLLKQPEVTVLHAKGIRVYTKTYNLSEISDTIIDFAVTMKETMVLSYQDFTYAIKDPYYRKDMRELSFASLLMVPFAEETEKITGVAFFYFSEKLYPEDDIIAQINPKSLRKLKDTLIQDEIEALHSEIVKQVYADTALPWVIMSDQRVYLSTPMAKVLGRESGTVSLSEWEELLKKNGKLNPMKRTELFHSSVEYYAEHKATTKNEPVFAVDYLDQHDLERFTLLFLAYRGWEDKTTWDHIALLSELLPQGCEKPLLYKVNDDTIVFLVSETLDKRLLVKIESRLKDYLFVFLRSGRDFPVKLALRPIVDYLVATNAPSFVLSEYLEYRTKQNEHQYLLEAIRDNRFNIKEYPVCRTADNQRWGTLIKMEVRGAKPTPDFQEFQFNKMMQFLLVNQVEKPIFFLDSLLLKKRSVWNQLKKIGEIYPDAVTLIVTNNFQDVNNANPNYPSILSEYFHRLHQMGITVLVDSTLFSSNLSYQLFPLFEGLAIEDWGLFENELGKTLINFYLNRMKQVIVLKTTANLQHDLIYHLNKPTN